MQNSSSKKPRAPAPPAPLPARRPLSWNFPASRAAFSTLSALAQAPRTGALPPPQRLLKLASDWVGYGLYLDLVADLKTGSNRTPLPLGRRRGPRPPCHLPWPRKAKQVALVCSGDAGIYAMAALVYEIIDLEPNRIAVEVIPGISAFQAAAAKAGAMIGHDFCCISLSDLLTPWEVIEKRVKAAAEGDFVISFYNPRSLKRRDQLRTRLRNSCTAPPTRNSGHHRLKPRPPRGEGEDRCLQRLQPR